MTDYKVNFKDLKAKVGIDDVAYALGYRLDRKAVWAATWSWCWVTARKSGMRS